MPTDKADPLPKLLQNVPHPTTDGRENGPNLNGNILNGNPNPVADVVNDVPYALCHPSYSGPEVAEEPGDALPDPGAEAGDLSPNSVQASTNQLADVVNAFTDRDEALLDVVADECAAPSNGVPDSGNPLPYVPTHPRDSLVQTGRHPRYGYPYIREDPSEALLHHREQPVHNSPDRGQHGPDLLADPRQP